MPSTVNVSRAVRLALSESSTTTRSTVDAPPDRWRHRRPLGEVLAVGIRCVCQLRILTWGPCWVRLRRLLGTGARPDSSREVGVRICDAGQRCRHGFEVHWGWRAAGPLWQVGLMRSDGPSLTALYAARHRAIHQVLDGGAIFEDPVALALLGLEPSEIDPALRADQSSERMRRFIAARSRFAEDRGRAAVRFGLSQVVVLGPGLDSFAYRLTSDPSVTVFEVDHPATQV